MGMRRHVRAFAVVLIGKMVLEKIFEMMMDGQVRTIFKKYYHVDANSV